LFLRQSGFFEMARIKNVEAYCSVCNGMRKMELAGEVAEQENKRWAKCKKCKQTMIIDINEDIKETKPSLEGIENSECITYSPQKSFEIGQSIYHQNRADFGKVVSKDVLASGQKSISVEFQKSGHKKLIEALIL
jgi:hypothetical protein